MGARRGSGALAGGLQCAILAQNHLLASIVNQQSISKAPTLSQVQPCESWTYSVRSRATPPLLIGCRAICSSPGSNGRKSSKTCGKQSADCTKRQKSVEPGNREIILDPMEWIVKAIHEHRGLMWTCAKCGEKIEDQFSSCWRCSSLKGVAEATGTPIAEGSAGKAQKWRMAHRMFRGTLATWETLFAEAAQFATEIGPERVLNLSHSADRGDGVVTVWYWTTDEKSES